MCDKKELIVVSIHQPNFMPWLPFFDKIEKSDIFVILGHCQFEKNNFQNRFKIEDQWQTLRVKKGNKPIIEKEYVNAAEDWEIIKRKSPQYKTILDRMDCCISNDLLDTNTKIIKFICDELNIKTKIVTDYSTDFQKSERLYDLCKYYSATHYLSGPSGKNYLDENIFKKSDIGIIYQDNSNLVKKPIVECLTV